MLSLGTSFASDDVAEVAAIDDVAIEEPIAVEEDTSLAVDGESSSNVVTNDTVYNFFDEESGIMLSNVTSDELIFEGTFENLNFSSFGIFDNGNIKWTGNGAVLNNISLSIFADNVTVTGFTINEFDGSYAISVVGSDVTVSNSEINYVDNGEQNSFGINALNSQNFKLLDNVINYVGNSNGYNVNKAIYITLSPNSEIRRNKINASLISAPVGWEEVPAGSGNWLPTLVISEGVSIEDSDDVVFSENEVNVVYSNVSGAYDTIYSVAVKNSSNIAISNNTINSLGHTYIYGIQISGENFTIEENNIISESDNYYANGIDVEGPAVGIIENNYINVTAVESVYGIYSGMNGQSVSTVIINNTIEGDAYNVFGLSLGDDESCIADNKIFLIGNYTTGIASIVANLIVYANNIQLLSSQQGNLSVWEEFGVEAVGIKIYDGNASITNNYILAEGKGVSLKDGSVLLAENNITVIANEDADAFAIYARNLLSLNVINNTVQYIGATKGDGINDAVYIYETPLAVVSGNEFDLSLVSSYVPWEEVPAGSGNWVSFPVSEGIVIESSQGVDFSENTVNVIYNDVVGTYDTLYAVSIKDSDVAFIYGNKISALGHTYIYGMQISGEGFIISNNTIEVASDNYYANGIDIEGPALGAVVNNKVQVVGVESAYCIYSGMNGQNASVEYSRNTIKGEAYNVFGMSLGDVESLIEENQIALEGNYTTGIAYIGSNLIAHENVISAKGSNVGNLSVWENFGVENIGIKVRAGESQIIKNEILTSGDYAVDVRNNTASVHDNYLKGAKYVGDESVANATNAEVYNNTPSRLQSIISITEVSGDLSIAGILKDVEGNVIADAELVYSFNGTNATVKTDDKGIFELTNLTNGEINISFDGATLYRPYNTTITLKDIAPTIVKVESQFNITGGVITLTGYAVDTKADEEGMYYATELLDANGNPISGAKIQFAVNDKIYNRTTKENGSFNPYKLNMVRAGRYTMAFYFAGDDNYTGAFASVCVDLDKKPITIKASAKSYKASVKTKKYTATLSTIVGSSHDGKAYLSPKKVTLTVNGKTFTAKTNSQGKVTFKITNLSKKAKYKAKISYAGDGTYESASKTVTLTVK